ncbi:unnamed protein product [Orchesella dallaii]|uniref:C2H2-type domain-containing protein n=1 Tax=Orchesella dallaii TaxID=48710 RepID=A0ABP1RZQ7_9HEXA
MPRRKQDCPKRMKWELEMAAEMAAASGAAVPMEVDGEADAKGKDLSSSDEEAPTPLRRAAAAAAAAALSSAAMSDDSDSDSEDLKSDRISRGSVSPPTNNVTSVLDFSQKAIVNAASPSPTLPLPAAVAAAAVVNAITSATSSESFPLDLSSKKLYHHQKGALPTGLPPQVAPLGLPRKIPSKLWSDGPWNNGSSPGLKSPPIADLSSKALEKMSELSRPPTSAAGANFTVPERKGKSKMSAGAGSPWQAQWLAQSSGGTRDVLKCVCCRLTFPSLSALSTHMKETKHGVPGGPPANSISPPGKPSTQPPSQSPQQQPPQHSPQQDSSLLLKETVQLPRKLVRGQDVWLGKGAEQTRQILKCMWCGQSFRSLAEMTAHMQQTQHYTNIISQEQLISWRSAEDSKSPSSNSHVSAVLTCKVCDQAFSSLKELSNHMVKNSHYKEHIMRSITESGSRRRQSREKRKKSLPVRKLLELERANSEMSKKEIKITCEKCNEKIPAPVFVDHLRVCETGGSRRNSMSGQPMVVSSRSTGSIDSCSNATSEENRSPPPAVQDLSSKDSNSNTNSSGKGSSESSSVINAIEKMIEKSFDYRNRGAQSNTPSNNSTGGGPTGSSPNCTSPGLGATSILKRLGIDESVDYTKPLILDAPMGTPLGGGPPSSGSQVIPKYSSQRPRSTSSSDKSEETSTTKPQSGCSPALSPARSTVSSNSLSPPPNSNNSNSQAKEDGSKSSLSALSSMFESIGGSGSGNHSDHSGKGGSGNSGISQQGHHPLAALQKLCDIKADVTTNANSSRPTSTNSNHSNHSYRDGHFNTTSPDRIMTPSRPTSSTPPCWPTTADVPSKSPSSTASSTTAERGGGGSSGGGDRAGDQIFKCTFCDTPFLSKGAYRHHLAKMHFIKEKSPSTIPSSLVSSSTPEIANNNSTSANNSDSPTSKFIKYTELAKQLSSK